MTDSAIGKILLVMAVALAGGRAGAKPGEAPVPAALRCEPRINPFGFAERRPRLSWIIERRARRGRNRVGPLRVHDPGPLRVYE